MTIYQINVPNYCFISKLTAAMPIACSVFSTLPAQAPSVSRRSGLSNPPLVDFHYSRSSWSCRFTTEFVPQSFHCRSPEPYPAAECGCPTGRPRCNHKCSSRPYSRFSVPRSVPILSAFQYGSRSQFWASLILPPVQTGSSHGFARPRYK